MKKLWKIITSRIFLTTFLLFLEFCILIGILI